jgi:hypothetical protein
MHIRLMFPKEYLAHEDLMGRDVTMTISRVGSEQLRTEQGNEDKWCVYFAEMEARHAKEPKKPNKRLVLNVTCARSIAKLYGPETDAWIGKRITLYETVCMAFGKQTGCIRIRESAPKPKNGKAPQDEPEPTPPEPTPLERALDSVFAPAAEEPTAPIDSLPADLPEVNELGDEIAWITDKLSTILADKNPASTLDFVNSRVKKLPDGEDKIRLARLVISAAVAIENEAR